MYIKLNVYDNVYVYVYEIIFSYVTLVEIQNIL